jgi:pyruvate/2-oxoglutarate dehydrogenase complex dihydrolipoamide dehydrogenase (E3) component
MVCIGGGYIGVEMAQIMAALGVKVTLVTRGIILKHIDRDIIQELMNNMKKLGVEIILNAPHKSVKKEKNGSLTLQLDVLEGNDKVNAEKILIALGRPPNVDGLCLNKT